MNRLTRDALLSLLLILVGVAGCAADYHRYTCPCVRYRYCPPAPLPYTVYGGCPSPAVLNFRNMPKLPDQDQNDSETVEPSAP